ncbi:hypothetical protein OH77DRAFT_1393052 [Trametes cingulata]|nr:hypothetical protein OH77DRAFT_1393052 [Trametes cingulata]
MTVSDASWKKEHLGIRKASIFIFPPAVTPPCPAHIHQDGECERDVQPAERAERGKSGMYEGTFNEWMNLVSSWTGRGGSSLTY